MVVFLAQSTHIKVKRME